MKISRPTEPPILTARRLNPGIHQSWGAAICRYQKRAKVSDDDIVSHVADWTLEPRLAQWYNADAKRIDKLSLDEYLKELAKQALEKNWEYKLRDEILSSKQGSADFMASKNLNENNNAILASAESDFALTKDALRAQLEANLHENLRRDLSLNSVTATTFAEWADAVSDRDGSLKDSTRRVRETIEEERAQRKRERGSLASRITSPPPPKHARIRRAPPDLDPAWAPIHAPILRVIKSTSRSSLTARRTC